MGIDINSDILAQLELDSIKINLNLDKKPKFTDSKFGGVPYWDKNKEYPLDEYGNKMYLLAQINFEKESLMEPLPNKGLLQFFISKEKDYDFEEYKVIYHENIDYSITINDIEEMNLPNSVNKIDGCYPTPIYGEFALSFEKEKSLMAPNDNRLKKIVIDSMKKLPNKYDNNVLEDKLDLFNDYLYDSHDEIKYRKSRMLGYHFFIQSDERPDDYILLLQIDSEYDNKNINIMWGDCGICNFFIKKEDLKNLNFENVVFYWDCY